MRNPLIKRIPRELKSEWHKYLVIIVFMVIMIGVISGMYVGHDSMLAAVYSGRETLNLEDGSFELEGKASEDLLRDISTGEKADVRQYYIDEGIKEADKEVAKAVEEELEKQVKTAIEENVRATLASYGITDEEMIREKIDEAMKENFDSAFKEAGESEEFQKAEKEAYEEAHKTVTEKVDEEWSKIADRYDLNQKSDDPVRVKLFENFYRDEEEDFDLDGTVDATVRIFLSDSKINLASLNEGRFPEKENEIAIDRMHADNVGVKVGDTIKVGDEKFEVVGLLSYVNYLTLHKSNKDLMFDAFGFNVAMVTPEAFDSLSARVHYNYSWQYEKEPGDKIEKADYSETFMRSLITQSLVYENEVKDYLPEYLRQASNFAISDIEGDSAGASILCYILIGVIAFIFAITISNTIDKEASVIGTLRASGYSRSELIFHYMSMPVIVTILGAVIGNVLGYTLFKEVALNLYYNTYSLPSCKAVWSNTALIKTTVIPLLLMFFVNLFVIVKKLQLTPLQFLRHDLVKRKSTKAMRLPKWSFLRRFRLRILFQNLPNYGILIFGVIFIELMLCFAFGLPDSLSHYAEEAPSMMFAEYQYMLMSCEDEDGAPVETVEPTAERFSMTNLLYPKKKATLREGMGSGGDEGVSVYGISNDSSYIRFDRELKDGEVCLSSAFAKKFGIREGEQVTLREEYKNQSYEFQVAGIINYDGGIAVFLDREHFDEVFEMEAEEFSGFFSHHEITDLEDQNIAMVITKDDILKVTNQLEHSMGGMMTVFKYALIVLTAALIYLLAKIIIERNEHAISMTKILGFKNSEIGSLYIIPTAIVVSLSALVAFVVGYYLMILIFKIFLLQMDGFFSFYMSVPSMILSILYLLIGYAFVSVIDFLRIKRIPLDVALKNAE